MRTIITSPHRKKRIRGGRLLQYLSWGVSLLTLVAVGRIALAADAEKVTEAVLMLRISPSQYVQTITDIFGPAIIINGRFEPELRVDGLLAIGARKASISDSGFESYDEIARSIAQQVTDVANRETFVHCTPVVLAGRDDICARSFITTIGRLLYRRMLNDAETANQVKVAGTAATAAQSFYAGLATSLADMLVSPEFLFRHKHLEPGPDRPNTIRLDGYSKATVLSFFLWNTTPDDLLLKSAESGAIHTEAGLRRQIDRMLSSPRIEAGVRAFFSDMLGFNELDTLAKDPTFFPRYTLSVKDESAEQTLRTIVDHIIVRHGDYRDLFTTPHTFLTRSLAALYDVPLVDKAENGEPERWLPYTYTSGDPRVGILAQASFVALHSPAGRSSPTGRGKALRELILCQKVPPPPGNVDFKFVQDISNPEFKTTRSRLTAHRTEAVCAGCHRLTDPIGLALENFDSSGAYRTTENGVLIDASGELSGVKFSGPLGLGQAVHDDPATATCVAKRAFGFGAARLPDSGDVEWQQIQERFKNSRYDFLELLRQSASSDMLYRVPVPPLAATTVQQPVAGN
jgi:hypothetical protein